MLSNERLKRRFRIRRLNGVNIDAVVAGSKSKLNFWLTPEREAAAHPAREVASRAFHDSVSHLTLQAKLHSPSKVKRKLKEGPDRGPVLSTFEGGLSGFVSKASQRHQAENRCATCSDCNRHEKAKVRLQQTSATIGVSG